MCIIGSCGHQLTATDGPDGMGWPIDVAGYSRDYSPTVTHGHVCTKCRDWFERENFLLKSEEEIESFLGNEISDTK